MAHLSLFLWLPRKAVGSQLSFDPGAAYRKKALEHHPDKALAGLDDEGDKEAVQQHFLLIQVCNWLAVSDDLRGFGSAEHWQPCCGCSLFVLVFGCKHHPQPPLRQASSCRLQEAYEHLSNADKRREYDSIDEFDDSLPESCAPEDFYRVRLHRRTVACRVICRGKQWIATQSRIWRPTWIAHHEAALLPLPGLLDLVVWWSTGMWTCNSTYSPASDCVRPRRCSGRHSGGKAGGPW